MIRKFLSSITAWNENLTHAGLLWLRVMMGGMMAYHGYGKIFEGKMDGFTEGVKAMGFPMPESFAWAASLSEFAGAILIILGLLTRPAAAMVFITMSVAFFIRHAADPYQVKELALTYWVMSAAIGMMGSGKFGLDRFFQSKN